MKYKFFGQPNMLVKMRHRVPFQTVVEHKPAFRFDENGEYVTDDEELIEKLLSKFDGVPMEEVEVTEEATEEEPQLLYRCRKCGDGFDNKGKLLAHSRKCGKVE